jgi:hypothetical protein
LFGLFNSKNSVGASITTSKGKIAKVANSGILGVTVGLAIGWVVGF